MIGIALVMFFYVAVGIVYLAIIVVGAAITFVLNIIGLIVDAVIARKKRNLGKL